MKQHITVEDLSVLTIDQKERLRYLWIPKIYDLVNAEICKDAENDIFENIEFVVGKVDIEGSESYSLKRVNSQCIVSLQDICSMNTISTAEEDTEDNDDENLPSDNDEDTDSDELYDELEQIRPSIYSLDECLPLLSIGNMIEILISNHYDLRKIEFDVIEDEYTFSKVSKNYNDYDENFESAEICDVLWQAVLEVL